MQGPQNIEVLAKWQVGLLLRRLLVVAEELLFQGKRQRPQKRCCELARFEMAERSRGMTVCMLRACAEGWSPREALIVRHMMRNTTPPCL